MTIRSRPLTKEYSEGYDRIFGEEAKRRHVALEKAATETMDEVLTKLAQSPLWEMNKNKKEEQSESNQERATREQDNLDGRIDRQAK